MGFIKEDTTLLDPDSLGEVVGPCVSLMQYSSSSQEWYGTVLIACHSVLIAADTKLAYMSPATGKVDVPPEVLFSRNYGGDNWSVVRFPVRTTLRAQPAKIEYSIKLAHGKGVPSGTVHVPAATENWHCTAYSCYDQRQQPKTGTACWDKLVQIHNSKPFHLLMGTGDQLYNDNVWHEPAALKWVEIEPRDKMRATPFTATEATEIEAFYFGAYLRWLKFHPLGSALACIPQMNTWDDHDIFDGYGSYPDYLQNCAAFQQIFEASKKMYALFQLHSTDELKEKDHYFASPQDKGYSWITQLGPDLAVAAIDTRAGRSRETIVPQPLLDEFLTRVRALPASCKHLLLVSAVPISYPEVSVVDDFLTSIEDKNNWLVKTGVYNKLMNQFGEPELLDDVIDHWSGHRHADEKGRLLNSLRTLARERGTRVSLFSGDVHQCTYGFTSSTADNCDLVTDPGFIPQVVSSAIGYVPPGNPVVFMLDRFAGSTSRNILKASGGSGAMYETSGWLFKDSKPRPSVSPRFANRNNFTEISVRRDASGVFKGVPLLIYNVHVRKGIEPTEGEPDTTEHPIVVPPLLPTSEAALGAALQEEFVDPLKPPPPLGLVKRVCCCCCA